MKMKTSNKLLLVFFLALFFSAASLMVYAKSHMSTVDEVMTTENMDELNFGEGPVIEKLIADDLQASYIEMGDSFLFTIDPNSSKVTIKGDSAFISKLTYKSEDEFRIFTGGLGRKFNWPGNVHVTIGVKNVNDLNLDINGNAVVLGAAPLTYEKARLQLNGNASCELSLDVQNLDIEANGNGNFTLAGNTNNLDANVSGNGKLFFEKCALNSAKMNLSGNGKFFGNTVQDVTGHASGNAKIRLNEVLGTENISTSGNGRLTIRN